MSDRWLPWAFHFYRWTPFFHTHFREKGDPHGIKRNGKKAALSSGGRLTHDAFSASYANRILFLRDGEIYKEIMKGSSSRKEFFEQILEVLNTLGGGVNDVR